MNGVQLGHFIGYNDTDPTQPPILLRIPEEVYPLIGRVIGNWALLEQEMDSLIWAVCAALGVGRDHRSEFSKRRKFLKDRWGEFAAGNEQMLKEMDGISSNIDQGKRLRDYLAHRRAFPGFDEKGPFIRFQTENKGLPWSKAFRDDDFAKAAGAIAIAAGRLYRLMDTAHGTAHFSFESKSLLQRLPRTDHLRFPMPSKPPRQRRP